jgi:hypothetical protein
MKKLLLLFAVCGTYVFADLSMDQIRDMVVKIHEKREGIVLDSLEDTKEPFVRLAEENNVTTFVIPVKEEATKLTLHAILNGKVYINNEWKKIGDEVGGFTLKYIGQKGVVLRNGNQIKKLFLHKERENFITIEGEE